MSRFVFFPLWRLLCDIIMTQTSHEHQCEEMVPAAVNLPDQYIAIGSRLSPESVLTGSNWFWLRQHWLIFLIWVTAVTHTYMLLHAVRTTSGVRTTGPRIRPTDPGSDQQRAQSRAAQQASQPISTPACVLLSHDSRLYLYSSSLELRVQLPHMSHHRTISCTNQSRTRTNPVANPQAWNRSGHVPNM